MMRSIIAFVFDVHFDRSVNSSGILYIFVVVMLVLTSVRKIGAVTFLAAVTDTLSHMVTIMTDLPLKGTKKRKMQKNRESMRQKMVQN